MKLQQYSKKIPCN